MDALNDTILLVNAILEMNAMLKIKPYERTELKRVED